MGSLGLILTLRIAVTLFFLPVAAGIKILGILSILLGIGVGFIPAAPNIFIAEGTCSDERAVGYAAVTLISRFLQLLLAPLFGFLAQGFGLSNVFVWQALQLVW